MEATISQRRIGNKQKLDCTITALSDNFASAIFKLAADRLLDVNKWHALTDSLLSTFQLTDDEGNEIHRQVRQSDHFKISIPSQGGGELYDWGTIEKVAYEKNSGTCSECVTLEAQVDSVTSRFVVSRKGLNVTAAVYGGEILDTESQAVIDKVKNAIVGAGTILGRSRVQWRSFVNGILSDLEETESYCFKDTTSAWN